MEVVNPSMTVSRLDLVVLDSEAAGIDFRRLPQGFWNIGVFIEQRGGSGGTRGGHNPPGCVWAPGHALVGAAPLEAPLRYFLGPLNVFWPKKCSKSFAVFGLRLVFISYDVKNMQKQQLAHGTMSIGQSIPTIKGNRYSWFGLVLLSFDKYLLL